MDIDRYFANRRTVRRYTAQEVAPELLTQLLEEATHAPNTGNMQLYSVIVTRSEEGKRALAPLHFNQPAATGCSVLLTFCIDINRFNLWCKEGNADAGFGNLQMLLAGQSTPRCLPSNSTRLPRCTDWDAAISAPPPTTRRR